MLFLNAKMLTKKIKRVKEEKKKNKDKTRKEFRQARRQRPLRSCKKRTREFSSIISTNHEVRFQASKIDNRREYFLFNGNEGVPLKGETSLFSFANLPTLSKRECEKCYWFRVGKRLFIEDLSQWR